METQTYQPTSHNQNSQTPNKPTTSFEDGLTELAGWAKTHGWDAADLFEKALNELREKHLAT